MKKISIIFIVILISLELKAQGKIYLEPYLGFFVSRSKGNNLINRNQNLIRNYYFGAKDLAVGGKLSYISNKTKISLGYETSYYTSTYRRKEKGMLPRIDITHASSAGPFNSIYAEYAKQLINFNVKLPNSFKKWIKTDDDLKYLISSKISPVLGIEYRFIYSSFVNDFNFPRATIRTTNEGNYNADIQYLHLNNKGNFTLRSGINWEFFNGEKHKFTLVFLYKFGFKNVGYWQYHFKSLSNTHSNFNYQTTTRGNGFCIYASIPIKLYTSKK